VSQSDTRNDQKFGRVEGVPEGEPCFILRAKDRCAVDAILAYADLCRLAGSPPEHVAEVGRQAQRFERWQAENLERLKIPD
jgi:hypothetical protein